MPDSTRIDDISKSPEEELLMRARRHLHCGKIRLNEGKISLGIVTLYDALVSAMQWFVCFSERKRELHISGSDDLKDDGTIFDLLVREELIDRNFNFKALDELVNIALKKDISSFDCSSIVIDIEAAMAGLGVVSLEESGR